MHLLIFTLLIIVLILAVANYHKKDFIPGHVRIPPWVERVYFVARPFFSHKIGDIAFDDLVLESGKCR